MQIDAAKAAGIIALGALGTLILLRKGVGGLSVKVG